MLPLLHRNGYKISNPTVPGTMSNPELRALMEGYGWRPWFVDGDDLDVALADVLDAGVRRDPYDPGGCSCGATSE